MNNKRILIISGESWREDSNGGNVLSNLFSTFTDEYEFAQIFTNPAMPSNSICTKYFHISEGEVVKTFLKNQAFGRELQSSDYLIQAELAIKNTSSSNWLTFLKKLNFPIFHTLQDLIWRGSKWQTPELERFILDYNPDVIFAPMYYSLFMHRIDRYVAKLTNKKLVSYVSDDHLTFRQFSLSPVYWFNRLLLRKNVIATAKHYSLLYTMTQEQLEEYQPVLKVPMKVLKKTGNFEGVPPLKTDCGNPLIIMYGGNLIYNRFKTLHKLAQAIKEINQNGIKIQLHIYTQTPITEKLKLLLDDGQNSLLLGKISMEQLNVKYSGADLVLHVESFELKQRLLTRLSFSTKIIDLMHTGRGILAICSEESSPYKYLKSEDAAICVADVSEIKKTLQHLLEFPEQINEYASKAWECGVRNHDVKIVAKDLHADFKSMIN
jgi:glycosyltransferase involved in cell wall biosynthesis